MKIVAIDPGTTKSAVVVYDGKKALYAKIAENTVIANSSFHDYDHTAIEMVASYGMAVGASTFETVFWSGRFAQQSAICRIPFTKVYRKDIKMHMCGSMRAKDGNVRQALIDRFPATGGGKTPQIGTKKKPGPLFGVSSHMWAALAVAVYWWDNYGKAKQ